MRNVHCFKQGPVCHRALLVLVSVMLAGQAQAQIEDVEDISPVAMIGFTLMGGFPVGEFSKSVTNSGIGGSVYAGYMLPRVPAVIGLDLGFMTYGTEKRDDRFSQSDSQFKTSVVTSNEIRTLNAFLRLQKRSGTLRPYLEGIVGIHYLFANTELEFLAAFYGGNQNLDNHAFAWGGGAGISIEVWSGREIRTSQNHSEQSVSIDLRMRYHDGDAVDYWKKGFVVLRYGRPLEFKITETTTDLITASLGLAIEF